MAGNRVVTSKPGPNPGETVTVDYGGDAGKPKAEEAEPDPVAEAERRYVEGEIGEDELERIERESRFERLRREREERKAAKEEERQRKRQRTELAKEVRTYYDSNPLADLRAKQAEAQRALGTYLDAVLAHNDTVSGFAGRGARLGGVDDGDRTGVRLPAHMPHISRRSDTVRVDGEALGHERVEDGVLGLAIRALGRHAPKGGEIGGRPLVDHLRALGQGRTAAAVTRG